MRPLNLSVIKSSEAGFSLIEILVTTVLMIIILGSVFGLMRSSIFSANTNYEVTKVQQSLRFAQEYINRDLTASGQGVGGTRNIYLRKDFVSRYLTTQNWASLEASNPPGNNYALMSVITSDNNVVASATNSEIHDLAGADSGRTGSND